MTQKQYLDPTRVTLVRHVITSEGKRQWQKKDYYNNNWVATENNPYEVKTMKLEPDSILSSSVSIVINNQHWFRKTDGDNIMWIAMTSDYYYAYRAVEKQWWYVDEDSKFKVDKAPDVEAIYQEMKKP